jgi:tripartite-type tricarboxylate transporter receptor subunit TctC
MRVQVFNAIFAPAGTPNEALQALHQATVKAKGDALLREGLAKAGAELVADSSPEKAARYVRDEIARWTPIVKASGFKIE